MDRSISIRHCPVSSSVEAAAERKTTAAQCPGCKTVFVAYLDSRTGQVVDNWYSNDQVKFLHGLVQKRVKAGSKPRGHFTRFRENADYVFLWTQAEGFRPYLYFVPHAQLESATVSGTYTSMGSAGYQWGTMNGTVWVQRNYYEPVQGAWNYLDVTLVVYDGPTGRKLYETWHRGNFRWSKPDKDCLVDALEFVSGSKLR